MDRLESLHRAYAPQVKAYALRRGDAAAADDVCSEVWLVAWRKQHQIPDDALPWLLAVARRVLSNHRRAQRRLSALRARISVAGLTGPVAAPRMDSLSDRGLARALAQLSARDRETLLLVGWEGLTPAQAASALGIRESTFGMRLHRARQRLEHHLDDEPARPSVPVRSKTQET